MTLKRSPVLGCDPPIPDQVRYRWHELVARANGTSTFLEIGVRDPDHPCGDFAPGDPGEGECQTDGHYLCFECRWILIRCQACEGPIRRTTKGLVCNHCGAPHERRH